MRGLRVGVLIALVSVGMVSWGQAAAPVAPASAAVPAGAPAAEKAPMSEKQRLLLEETNALLKLAAELKVSVDKSTKDQLSLDVVRKAEAVEKMAKELKGKMK